MKANEIIERPLPADKADAVRLLLVDDEEMFRESISRRLGRRGIQVLEAGGGAEALSVLKGHAVDVVVSDVKMPAMNGLELLRQIKKNDAGIEVILLTGHASTADGVEGIKSGAFDYLGKPVEFDHLLRKIRQAHEKILFREAERKAKAFRETVEQQMIVTERLASLGTLATGVAHEINNPLAIIREAAGWMGQILEKDEMASMPRKSDFKRALGKIDDSVERARKITHQLLGFVQKTDAAVARVDINMLMDESAHLVEREAANKGITITTEKDEGLGPIYSDPYQIRQVLLNLITNAVHATPDGGTITLGSEMRGGNVVMTIADTGEGIPAENMKKIFEPFFTTKSPGKGTGLGLYVSRGIMERLDGTITVESALGRGTIFTLTLPVTTNSDDNTGENPKQEN
jgi:signal transduction histidine kinase